MQACYEAISVGGGQNGPTGSAHLARAGPKALVPERRGIVGGAAVTQELQPGFRAPGFGDKMGRVHPSMIADPGLEHLKLTQVVHPFEDDTSTFVSTDIATTRARIARFSQKDVGACSRAFADIAITIVALCQVLLETPVDPGDRRRRALLDVARMDRRHRSLGKEVYRLTEAMTQSACDCTSRGFEGDQVTAVFCYGAGIGKFKGPRAAHTACSILFHLLGENRLGSAKGGMGAADGRRAIGTCLKISRAVGRPPPREGFTLGPAGVGYPAHDPIGPKGDDMERAHDDAKYGPRRMAPIAARSCEGSVHAVAPPIPAARSRRCPGPTRRPKVSRITGG